jgi:polyisoprenoid-binding protein YceI
VADDPLASTVEVTIDADSIDTGNADRDAHLRGPEFLDVATFPALTFRGREIVDVRDDGFRLVGDLTIRDVTREVALEVEFDGVAVSPWAQEVAAFTATTEIDRQEFGVTWNAALEAGGVVVSNHVKIEITAEATRQV